MNLVKYYIKILKICLPVYIITFLNNYCYLFKIKTISVFTKI